MLHRGRHTARILIFVSSVIIPVLAMACGGEGDENAGGGTASGDWQVVMSDLPGALTSVWGTSATDIWAIGADPEGAGNTVKHYDGETWTDMATGETGDLWWVFGFEGGPVYFGGAGGLILRYEAGQFERMETPGDAIVYGIWGASEDDLWAVGGNVTADAFAWRYDGTSWTTVPGFPPVIANSASMFKVWGAGPDDVWLVGTGGTILHYDGDRLTQVVSQTTRDLFGVSGREGLAAAVGGFGTGVIVENDGNGWQDVTPPETPQVIGVFVGQDASYAVGVQGAVLERRSGRWVEVDTGLDLDFDLDMALHTVWVDPEGGVWAVGGNVIAPPLVDGIMLYKSPSGTRS